MNYIIKIVDCDDWGPSTWGFDIIDSLPTWVNTLVIAFPTFMMQNVLGSIQNL